MTISASGLAELTVLGTFNLGDGGDTGKIDVTSLDINGYTNFDSGVEFRGVVVIGDGGDSIRLNGSTWGITEVGVFNGNVAITHTTGDTITKTEATALDTALRILIAADTTDLESYKVGVTADTADIYAGLGVDTATMKLIVDGITNNIASGSIASLVNTKVSGDTVTLTQVTNIDTELRVLIETDTLVVVALRTDLTAVSDTFLLNTSDVLTGTLDVTSTLTMNTATCTGDITASAKKVTVSSETNRQDIQVQSVTLEVYDTAATNTVLVTFGTAFSAAPGVIPAPASDVSGGTFVCWAQDTTADTCTLGASCGFTFREVTFILIEIGDDN